MIEPLNWPVETNALSRDELLKNKLNELIRAYSLEHATKESPAIITVREEDLQTTITVREEDLQTWTRICSHEQTRVLKNGRKFCDGCKKFVKG